MKIVKICLILCSIAISLSFTTENKPTKPDDNLFIEAINYNIWGLPVWLPGIERKKRYPKIVKHLLERQASIVCLQECFHPLARKTILKHLKDEYKTYSDYTCNDKSIFKKDCHGGLVTLSKFDISKEEFYRYPIQEGMNIVEKKGRKGFILSTLKTDLGEINVINTHLYSGRGQKSEAIRLLQVKRMNEIIDSLNLKENPILLMGDLNCAHPSLAKNEGDSKVYHYLTDSLHFQDTKKKVKDNEVTYDTEKNHYGRKFYYKSEGKQKLDYCLFYTPSTFKFDLTESNVIFKEEHAYSDHYGLFSKFSIRRKNNPKAPKRIKTSKEPKGQGQGQRLKENFKKALNRASRPMRKNTKSGEE